MRFRRLATLVGSLTSPQSCKMLIIGTTCLKRKPTLPHPKIFACVSSTFRKKTGCKFWWLLMQPSCWLLRSEVYHQVKPSDMPMLWPWRLVELATLPAVAVLPVLLAGKEMVTCACRKWFFIIKIIHKQNKQNHAKFLIIQSFYVLSPNHPLI